MASLDLHKSTWTRAPGPGARRAGQPEAACCRPGEQPPAWQEQAWEFQVLAPVLPSVEALERD